MLLRIVRISLTICASAAPLLPFIVSAQALDSTAPFSLRVSPQHPAPYSKAVLTPTSGSVDLANAVITVDVGGKQIYQGGAQPLTIPLGAAGEMVTVRVTATSNGTRHIQSVSIRPQDVVLVAEPVSSSPPLYKGKPLVPLDGTTRIVAVTNMVGISGKTIDRSALSYSWYVDGAQIAGASGIGRDTLTVASPLQYRERGVRLDVRSQDGSVVGGASLTLTPHEPIVRIYENDPLLGIMTNRAISNSFSIDNSEKSLYAAAYSFPTSGGALVFKWFLNSVATQTGDSITLRPSGTGRGTASLSLVATAGQYATVTVPLTLSFGATANNNFFGL